MTGIFLSYRRADSQANTDRIYDRLVSAFGRKSVFKDVNNIPLGEDFPTYLDRQLANASIVLIMIGRDWATITDGDGNQRLHDPHDFVRLEVETALHASHLTAIPVLVNGAQMPDASLLPDSLQSINRRNAILVRNDPDFDNDIERLVENLRDLGFGKARQRHSWAWWIIIGLALIASVLFITQLVSQVTPTTIDANNVTDSETNELTINPTRDVSGAIDVQLLFAGETSLTVYANSDSHIGYVGLVFGDQSLYPYEDFAVLQSTGGILFGGQCLRYVLQATDPILSRSCSADQTTDVVVEDNEAIWYDMASETLTDATILLNGADMIAKCDATVARCAVNWATVP